MRKSRRVAAAIPQPKENLPQPLGKQATQITQVVPQEEVAQQQQQQQQQQMMMMMMMNAAGGSPRTLLSQMVNVHPDAGSPMDTVSPTSRLLPSKREHPDSLGSATGAAAGEAAGSEAVAAGMEGMEQPGGAAAPGGVNALPLGVRDIDSDQLEFVDYIKENMAYLKDLERRRRPRPNYMLKQRDVNPNMRAILVDWLVEVTIEFKLRNESLHLTVNIIDRFLSMMYIKKEKLQLVGVAAMFIACKVEEIDPPILDDFVYICDKTYDAEEIRGMEFHILRHIKFELTHASPLGFCSRLAKAGQLDRRTAHLAQYLCDLSMQDYHCLKYIPSEIAASAVVVALHTVDQPHWSRSLQHYSGYFLEDLLKDCVPALLNLFRNSATSSLPSLRVKYSSSSHSGVALLTPKRTLPDKINV